MSQTHWFERVVDVIEVALNDDPDLFWRSVTREEGKDGECWRYSAFPGLPAFPPVIVLGQMMMPPDVAFFLTHGRWADGLRPICGDQLCVNPYHLQEITHVEELIDRSHHQRRLTDDEVKELRRLHKAKRWSCLRIARHFDIDLDNAEHAFWGTGKYGSSQ